MEKKIAVSKPSLNSSSPSVDKPLDAEEKIVVGKPNLNTLNLSASELLELLNSKTKESSSVSTLRFEVKNKGKLKNSASEIIDVHPRSISIMTTQVYIEGTCTSRNREGHAVIVTLEKSDEKESAEGNSKELGTMKIFKKMSKLKPAS